MQHCAEPLGVQTGPDGVPLLLSCRDRSWRVRAVTAHWSEPAPWWSRQVAPTDGRGPTQDRQVWRVVADPGPVVLDVARAGGHDGGWWLERAALDPTDDPADDPADDRGPRPASTSSRHQEAS